MKPKSCPHCGIAHFNDLRTCPICFQDAITSPTGKCSRCDTFLNKKTNCRANWRVLPHPDSRRWTTASKQARDSSAYDTEVVLFYAIRRWLERDLATNGVHGQLDFDPYTGHPRVYDGSEEFHPKGKISTNLDLGTKLRS